MDEVEATYRVSVHQNGQIIIGLHRSRQLTGDEFEIKFGLKHIPLIQLDSNKSSRGYCILISLYCNPLLCRSSADLIQ